MKAQKLTLTCCVTALFLASACSANEADYSEPVELATIELGKAPTWSEIPIGLSSQESADWIFSAMIKQAEKSYALDAPAPLAEGWIKGGIYSLVRDQSVTYVYLIENDPAGPPMQACLMKFPTTNAGYKLPEFLVMASKRAGNRGCKLADKKIIGLLGLNSDLPTAGALKAQKQFNEWSVKLVGNWAGLLALPLPRGEADEQISALFRLPGDTYFPRNSELPMWIAKKANGSYALSVRFDLSNYSDAKHGCVIEKDDGSFPRKAWITQEIKEWCITETRRFATPRDPIFEPRGAP